MLGKTFLLILFLFVVHCESSNKMRNDDTGANDNNNNDNPNKGFVSNSGVANITLSVEGRPITNSAFIKEVGELFAIKVSVTDIDLSKVADGYGKKLMALGEKLEESDLQVQLSVEKNGEQKLVFEDEFLKNGEANFTSLYADKTCEGCQFVARLGSYGNRGCADDCDYPFVPIEPSTAISAGTVTFKDSTYALQAHKEGTNNIKITLTKNGVAAAGLTVELTACVFVPQPSIMDWGRSDDITYCSTPDFAGYGGQQAIAKREITLDDDGSWSGEVDEAVRDKICKTTTTVYVQVEGRAFIEGVSGCPVSSP